tara:strand:- start:263 stop:568 length:306 start_codon:yes stop_codon:yes gene_type:complete
MAILSTIGKKTVGTSAVQLTANTPAATMAMKSGIVLTVPAANTGLCYWGPSTVTTATGFPIINTVQIAPAEFDYIGDIYFISDTASQTVCFDIVGQTVTIS